MNSFEFNLAQLTEIARALDQLLPEVTFVGGCTTFLFVDESAYLGVRQTQDVDVIVEAVTTVEYGRISKRLRKLGFKEDVNGPICRWLWDGKHTEIRLDVMPTGEEVLGFSNAWYHDAIKNADSYQLQTGLNIAVVSPVYFLATKFEAFKGRGNGDYFSHDIEDIMFVLENRSGILHEILNASENLKEYLSIQFKELTNDRFLNILPGILNDEHSKKSVTDILAIVASRPWRSR